MPHFHLLGYGTGAQQVTGHEGRGEKPQSSRAEGRHALGDQLAEMQIVYLAAGPARPKRPTPGQRGGGPEESEDRLDRVRTGRATSGQQESTNQSPYLPGT